MFFPSLSAIIETMTTDHDRILVAQLLAGDPTAVADWYHHYQPRLSAFIAHRVGSPEDVEELVQETFINCLHNLPNFLGKSSLWTWMCAIARHEVGDYYRKRYAKKVLHLLPLSDWLLADFLQDNHHADYAHDLADQVEQVFARIGYYYRSLLLAKYLDQQSVADLARRYDKTIKALESDLYRARQAFKRVFQELDD